MHCIAHILHFEARTAYSTYSKELGESGGSAAWRVRYSTYSTYSKEPGESGGSAAWRVRYSTYSTYSKGPGESGCSAAWRGRVAHAECQPDMLKQLGSDAGQGWRLQCQAGGAAGEASMQASRATGM